MSGRLAANPWRVQSHGLPSSTGSSDAMALLKRMSQESDGDRESQQAAARDSASTAPETLRSFTLNAEDNKILRVPNLSMMIYHQRELNKFLRDVHDNHDHFAGWIADCRAHNELQRQQYHPPETVADVSGEALDEFRIQRPVASQELAQVFFAIRVQDRFPCALKQLRRPAAEAFSDEGGVWAANHSGMLEELAQLRRLEHVNLVTIFDVFEEPGSLNVVTEWCSGGSLGHKLHSLAAQRQILDERMLWAYFSQICAGVAHLHEHQLYNLNLRPANVLLNSQGEVKITDMGVYQLQRRVRGTLASTLGERQDVDALCGICPEILGRFLAEAEYPEAARGVQIDARTAAAGDAWALGSILYEMAELRPPFLLPDMQGQPLRLMRRSLRLNATAEMVNQYTPRLAMLVERLLVSRAVDRLQVAVAMQAALKACCDENHAFLMLLSGNTRTWSSPHMGDVERSAVPLSGQMTEPRHMNSMRDFRSTGQLSALRLDGCLSDDSHDEAASPLSDHDLDLLSNHYSNPAYSAEPSPLPHGTRSRETHSMFSMNGPSPGEPAPKFRVSQWWPFSSSSKGNAAAKQERPGKGQKAEKPSRTDKASQGVLRPSETKRMPRRSASMGAYRDPSAPVYFPPPVATPPEQPTPPLHPLGTASSFRSPPPLRPASPVRRAAPRRRKRQPTALSPRTAAESDAHSDGELVKPSVAGVGLARGGSWREGSLRGLPAANTGLPGGRTGLPGGHMGLSGSRRGLPRQQSVMGLPKPSPIRTGQLDARSEGGKPNTPTHVFSRLSLLPQEGMASMATSSPGKRRRHRKEDALFTLGLHGEGMRALGSSGEFGLNRHFADGFKAGGVPPVSRENSGCSVATLPASGMEEEQWLRED